MLEVGEYVHVLVSAQGHRLVVTCWLEDARFLQTAGTSVFIADSNFTPRHDANRTTPSRASEFTCVAIASRRIRSDSDDTFHKQIATLIFKIEGCD